MTVLTNQLKLEVSDSSRMPRETFLASQTGAELPSRSLFADPDIGPR